MHIMFKWHVLLLKQGDYAVSTISLSQQTSQVKMLDNFVASKQ